MTRWPTRNFRPNPAYYDPANTAADEAGYSMNVLLQALLREFISDPVARLASLRPHLQAVAEETPRRGRPGRGSSRRGRD